MVESKPAPDKKGNVITQHPSAGTELAPGSTVRLVVSEGWPTVPNFEFSFRGYKLVTAKRLVRNRGLQVGAVILRYDSFHSLYSPGKVFGSMPKGSTEVRPGSSVTLVVAKPFICTPGYFPCIRPIVQNGFLAQYDCWGNGGDGPYYVYVTERVSGEDVYGLDGDNDGYGCE